MFKRIFIILIAAFIFVQYVGTSHGASSDSSSDNYLDQYKEVLLIFRGGQPYIHEPYEENEKKVVFSKFEFDGESKEFTFEFIEDIV